VLDSPVGKKYLQEVVKTVLKQNADLQKPLTAAGVDPLKDVSSVVVAASDVAGDKVLVIVRGTFDPDKAQAAAEDFARKNPRQLVTHKEGELRVYEHKNGEQSAYVAFADRGTVLVSLSKKNVVEAARTGSAKTGTLKKEFVALLEKVDGKQAVWMAALAPEAMKKALAGNPNTEEIADKINAFTAEVGVDKDVQAGFRVHTADAKTADSVSEALDGFKGFAKLAAQNNKEVGKLLSEVVEGIKITTDKGVVNLNVKVTDEMIERGLKKGATPPAKNPPKDKKP
jgi:hypothetical protein